MTHEERDNYLEIDARLGDSDQARVYLAMSTTAWVQCAHNILDPYNQYDREMLGKMADYVERCGIIVGSAPFFAPPNDETLRKVFFLDKGRHYPYQKRRRSGKEKEGRGQR